MKAVVGFLNIRMINLNIWHTIHITASIMDFAASYGSTNAIIRKLLRLIEAISDTMYGGKMPP